MAIYPQAIQRLIPPGSNDPIIKPRLIILHVDGGNAYDLHDYFAHRSGGVESHFHIASDGTVFQYRDTVFQADANYRANDFAISIETQGTAAGEWSLEQLHSIKTLLWWLSEIHGIPLEKAKAWDGTGVGYHIQFGAPGYWTPVAKSCPGIKRIRQFENVIVPWMLTVTKRVSRGRHVDEAIRNTRRAARAAQRRNRLGRYRVLSAALDILESLKGK